LAIRGVRAGGDKLDAAAFAQRTGLRPGALLGGGDRSAA
jgi:hypothetical protein